MANRLLEADLGVKFREPGLLQQALVHRSYLNEQGGKPSDSYERLEFLGDAVIELAVSTRLYEFLPNHSEGDLTKARATLVCGESLAVIARRLRLGDHVLLGKGEEATGGRDRESTLAATMEAVVAAVYQDQGFEAARSFVLRIMAPELDQFLLQGTAADNPKSRLQEHIQGLGRATPKYQLASSTGPDHDPWFEVEVLVESQVIGKGQGGKKADAERAAANDALNRIASEPIT
ncbi:MAG: ribonuclease III [SAR202 cluster bacterium Io17-Chloro-G2]|nr:MAG: ribonuclease III [SAR202 cluster bacterium Io17-Chloro-G2]